MGLQHNQVIDDTGVILKERYINEALLNDVKVQTEGLYRLNAGGAIGYLFTVTDNRKEIASGMFCHRLRDIEVERWDYISDLETGKIFKLYKHRGR